ncbi:hypothetical protein ILUMI_02803 [Ignelater luminosus]|uniref:DDE Tnp4 domain-containing protein n=1 Tax=Ignelater luminosus TaxID=2038154 RepID=A0A8K0DBY1_IGNLU|nr:hypothetical protein ILUMI_02803 [Ignelater luminosus]
MSPERRSGLSLDTNVLTVASYKHRNTLKGWVGVAPNGVFVFVSDLYPGSTFDKQIVANCSIRNELELGDVVSADKGILIKDLLANGVASNVPPFLSTPQFTAEQVQQTERIAKARIHKRLDETFIADLSLSFHEIYNNACETIHTAAKEALGAKVNKKSNKLWWTEEMEILLEEKKRLYQKWIYSRREGDRMSYVEKKHKVRRTITAAKNNMWDTKCQEINTYILERSTEAWKAIKENMRTT